MSLTRAGPGVWEAQLAIDPGVHRVAVRVDGGAWSVQWAYPLSLDPSPSWQRWLLRCSL
jgi:hypothetical protein